VKAVTVQVTPEQAEKLVLAASQGKLQLVMRNYGDQEDTQTKGVNSASLLSGETYVPQPSPPAEKSQVTPKPIAYRAPRIKHTNFEPPQEKPAASPVRRNSVEFIEGNKRRDVEIP
jgi:pilus assembly protein CpaB